MLAGRGGLCVDGVGFTGGGVEFSRKPNTQFELFTSSDLADGHGATGSVAGDVSDGNRLGRLTADADEMGCSCIRRCDRQIQVCWVDDQFGRGEHGSRYVEYWHFVRCGGDDDVRRKDSGGKRRLCCHGQAEFFSRCDCLKARVELFVVGYGILQGDGLIRVIDDANDCG